MSWNASGRIEGKAGEADFNDAALWFSPARADMAQASKAQADFLHDMIGAAFDAGVIDGAYSC